MPSFAPKGTCSRKFRLKESKEIQLRLDTFNVLNHPNLGLPTAGQNNATFGRILSQNGDGRTFQGAVKFIF